MHTFVILYLIYIDFVLDRYMNTCIIFDQCAVDRSSTRVKKNGI